MKFFAQTDVGRKYDHNEDFFVLPEPNEKYGIENIDVNKKGSLFVLCDGMGGGNAGEVISELTANWIIREYYSSDSNTENQQLQLKEIILNVNEKIKRLSAEHDVYKGWGTTLVAVLIIESKAYVFNVGDSRLYLLRGNEFNQITDDQSEVWKLFKDGTITKEEMQRHPHKHVLNNAIGMENELEINEYKLPLLENDILLMCSDGLTDMLSDEEIQKNINKKSLKKSGKKLIKLANKNGGRDNITVLLISV